LSEDQEHFNLPGGKAARKREAMIREGARLEAYDKTLGLLNGDKPPEAVPARPLHATAEDCKTLSDILVQTAGRFLPRGSHIEVADFETTTELQKPFGQTFEKRVTSVSIWPLGVMSLEEVLRRGILDRQGNVSMVAYETAMAAMDGHVERVVRPHEEAAIPGRLR
jgi:hypothetical protein